MLVLHKVHIIIDRFVILGDLTFCNSCEILIETLISPIYSALAATVLIQAYNTSFMLLNIT